MNAGPRFLGIAAPLFLAACQPPPERIAPRDAGPVETGEDAPATEAPPPDAPPAPAPGSRRWLAGEGRLVGRGPWDAVSASGRYAAAALDLSGKNSLYVVDLEAGETSLLVEDLRADPAETAWDGEVLVISSGNRASASSPFVGDVLLWRPDWPPAKRQRAVATVGLGCDVAPGDLAVACVLGQDSDAQTYNVSFGPVDGESETRVVLARQYYDSVHSYSFQWTPDGRYYVVSGRADASSPERITIHSAGDGALASDVGVGSRPRVSPDSAWVAYLDGLHATTDGILVGELRVAPVGGGGGPPPRALDTSVASALYLDDDALIALANPRGAAIDIRRVDLRTGGSPVTLAAGVDGLVALHRAPRRLAVVSGGKLRVLDGEGNPLCALPFEPPLGADVVRFDDAAANLVYAERAEIFLGVGAGRLADLGSCTSKPLLPLLRWGIPLGSDWLLASTANGRTGSIARTPSAGASVTVIQDRARLPFAWDAPRRLLLYAIDEGPEAGIYGLAIGP